MRLNRSSAVFLAVLLLVIAIAYIFLITPDGFGTTPATPVPTSSTVNLFPGLVATNINSLSITSQIPLGDTRATPIPGNPPLPTLTPLPFGAEGPSETKSIVLSYNASGVWVLGQGGTVSSTEPIMQQTVTTALTTLAGLRSSQSFTPADGNYAQYGLDTPNHDITFVVQAPAASTDPNGQAIAGTPTTRRLRLGNRSVDNTQFFAFLDEDTTTVYVILGASSLDSSVLRMVSQPPFTPAPTPTAAPVLNVPGLPFITFNYNLATSFSVTDHVAGTSVVLTKLPDNVTWSVQVLDLTELAATPEATAESTAEATAEVTAEATIAVSDLLGPQVDQLAVSVYLTEFGYINGVSRTTVADLSTLGLSSPHYTIQALMGDGTSYRLRVGNTDPTGTLYYSLVNDFTDVVLVEAGTVAPLLEMLANPPYVMEITPEVTVAPAEATAPAAEATVETTEAAGN
jgi:hypothetical protein